jgi:ubiquinone/menaquinone biosynthesis C-methylase UbiE
MDYNAIAKGYNSLHSEEQQKKLSIIKRHLQVRKSDLLLDVGCGTGLSSDFDCHVFGADPSINLLKQAKIPKVLALAEYLPFRNKTFDAVVSMTAVHNFNDKKKGLSEIKRVGKKRFALTVMKKSKYAREICSRIKTIFNPNKLIEEEKDFIFVTN